MILGTVRKMDDKGRILIPSFLLEQLGIKGVTKFNICILEGKLTLSPVEGSGGNNGQETRKDKG